MIDSIRAKVRKSLVVALGWVTHPVGYELTEHDLFHNAVLSASVLTFFILMSLLIVSAFAGGWLSSVLTKLGEWVLRLPIDWRLVVFFFIPFAMVWFKRAALTSYGATEAVVGFMITLKALERLTSSQDAVSWLGLFAALYWTSRGVQNVADGIQKRMHKKRRIPPDRDQLSKMLRKHITFEINRFRLAASMWSTPTFGGPVDAMIRESCLIHMRLLLDFFYPRSAPKRANKYEDVFVTDYLPEQKRLSREFRKLLMEPSWLQDYRNQLDWRLSHLTMRRIDFESKPVWSPEKQFEHLESLIAEFLKALPAELSSLFNPNLQG